MADFAKHSSLIIRHGMLVAHTLIGNWIKPPTFQGFLRSFLFEFQMHQAIVRKPLWGRCTWWMGKMWRACTIEKNVIHEGTMTKKKRENCLQGTLLINDKRKNDAYKSDRTFDRKEETSRWFSMSKHTQCFRSHLKYKSAHLGLFFHQ